jgi:hypothetical protein
MNGGNVNNKRRRERNFSANVDIFINPPVPKILYLNFILNFLSLSFHSYTGCLFLATYETKALDTHHVSIRRLADGTLVQ